MSELPDYTYELVPSDMLSGRLISGHRRCLAGWMMAMDPRNSGASALRALVAEIGTSGIVSWNDTHTRAECAGAWNRAMRALGYDISDAGCRLGE